MVDYHVVMDLLPVVSSLYLEKRLGSEVKPGVAQSSIGTSGSRFVLNGVVLGHAADTFTEGAHSKVCPRNRTPASAHSGWDRRLGGSRGGVDSRKDEAGRNSD